ncbi:MAG: hypothetical protein ABSD59_05380 [Terracidiphilus sp.]|jgi:hypothetical protein
MIRSINKTRLYALHVVSAVAFTLVAAGAHAQDTTTTSVRHGEPLVESNVRNAEIVYVEGNNLVVKLEDGKIEHMIVPLNEKFKIDGRYVTVRDLRAGTKLTQTVTSTTTPRVVTTVRVLKGKVWHVSAPKSVILTLPEGKNQHFQIPADAKFTMNGKPITAFDLRKGMTIEATIVTDEPQSVVAQNKSTVGRAPVPELPPMLGLLLFSDITPAQMPGPLASNVRVEFANPPAALPNTASSVPLAGLLGVLSIVSALGLGVARRLAKINV